MATVVKYGNFFIPGVENLNFRFSRSQSVDFFSDMIPRIKRADCEKQSSFRKQKLDCKHKTFHFLCCIGVIFAMGIDKSFPQIYVLNNFSAISLSRFRHVLVEALYNENILGKEIC